MQANSLTDLLVAIALVDVIVVASAVLIVLLAGLRGGHWDRFIE